MSGTNIMTFCAFFFILFLLTRGEKVGADSEIGDEISCQQCANCDLHTLDPVINCDFSDNVSTFSDSLYELFLEKNVTFRDTTSKADKCFLYKTLNGTDFKKFSGCINEKALRNAKGFENLGKEKRTFFICDAGHTCADSVLDDSIDDSDPSPSQADDSNEKASIAQLLATFVFLFVLVLQYDIMREMGRAFN